MAETIGLMIKEQETDMRSMNRRQKVNKLAKSAAAVMLAFCLAAGTAASAPAFAAAEFAGTSPFSSTGYSTYYHNGRYTGSPIAHGVDISDWQSAGCNIKSAKAKGVDFAILRVTYTGLTDSKFSYKNNDSSFASNFKKARDAGMLTGVYVFSQAKTKSEAKKEAKYALQRLKSLGIGPNDMELPVYMDYEFGGSSARLNRLLKSLGATKFRTRATSCANAFCNVIRDAGYTPGIYANTIFFSRYLNTAKIPADVDLWCAQYYKRCESSVSYSKWQYSSSARITGLLSYLGVKGNIDVNFWYLDTDSKLDPDVTVTGTLKYKYTGKEVIPKLTVKKGSKTLKNGSDYIAGYIDNTQPGPAYAYIKGIGSYSGYQVVPFTVKPPATSIKSLTAAVQGFTVKVAKQKKGLVTGYQVRYSRKSDMSESVKKTIGTKYSAVSNTITANARNTKYYVQVRSYIKVNGKKYYSSWSSASTVTSE